MPPKKNNKSKNGNGGTLGIENELWEAANKLCGHMEPGIQEAEAALREMENVL